MQHYFFVNLQFLGGFMYEVSISLFCSFLSMLN